MTNEHGLDARYFKEQLGLIVRDADNYTPDEMHRALTRLAKVAEPNECKHGMPLDWNCNACSDSGINPRK